MTFFSDLYQYSFMFYGLMTCLFLSIGFGVISPFIISKEQSFLPPAISHASLLGVSLGIYFSSTTFEIFIIALLVTSIISFMLSYSINHNKLPPDVFIGIFLTISMALGILINETLLAGQNNLFHFLFGNILLISKLDYLITFSVVLISILAILIPLKYWIFISYDPENAKNQGVPVHLFQYLFCFIITILVIASIKMTGIILVNALALIPGLLAFKVSRDIKSVIIYSCSFSFLTSFLGFFISSQYNISTGITIALTQFLSMILIQFIYKLKPKLKFN